MNWLNTPPKTRSVLLAINLTIITAPVVGWNHFFTRAMRGDYPTDSDSIGIPIFGFAIFIYPITIFILERGLRNYPSNVFLFTWSRRYIYRSLFLTIVTIYPCGLMSVAMVLDGIAGRLYWVSAFFVLHTYCLLILRASILADIVRKETRDRESGCMNSPRNKHRPLGCVLLFATLICLVAALKMRVVGINGGIEPLMLLASLVMFMAASLCRFWRV